GGPEVKRRGACLAPPCMKWLGNVMPARDLGNDRLGRQALPHHPQLLSKRPPPSPIRTGKHRHRHRVCPLICKSMNKPLTADASIDLSQAHPSSSGYGAGTLIMGVVAPVAMAVLATPVWIMFFNE